MININKFKTISRFKKIKLYIYKKLDIVLVI